MRPSGQNTHETDDVWSRLLRKTVVRQQPDDLTAPTDHDLSIERKPAREFEAQSCATDRRPDHERTGRADVDGTKVLQLSGEQSRSESSVAADVDALQKDNVCHV
jgi:hypothetical protein